MGYAFLLASCFNCMNIFSCNPNKVPSIFDEKGVRQPLCRNCAEKVQVSQKGRGIPVSPIHTKAYESVREEEL